MRRPLSIAILASLLVVGCTRPEDADRADESLPPAPTVTEPTTPATTEPTDSTEPSDPTDPTEPADPTEPTEPTGPPSTASSVAPATTVPPPTAPPPTAAPESPGDLVLTFDGIGPWQFGERDVEVVPGLAAILGAPVNDVLSEYPVADEGSFLDESGEQEYVAPFGRTVCFEASLCAQFGAGAPETLILTGWRLSEGAPDDIASEDGVTIGATWADIESIVVVDPLDSCFQVGYADAGGIEVVLLSASEPFAAPDDSGTFVANDLDPEAVTVIEMLAGRHPEFVFADC